MTDPSKEEIEIAKKVYHKLAGCKCSSYDLTYCGVSEGRLNLKFFCNKHKTMFLMPPSTHEIVENSIDLWWSMPFIELPGVSYE